MIINCASVLESPRRGAFNTPLYDFIIELLVIKYYDLVFCDNFMHVRSSNIGLSAMTLYYPV